MPQTDNLLESMERLIRAAWDRRAGLRAGGDTDAYRIFHGWSEGLPGLEIDAFGEVALIVCKSADPELVPRIAELVAELGEFQTVVGRQRGRESKVYKGRLDSPSVTVRELGIRYEVEPLNPQHPGLYLDARPAREWLVENSAHLRILNLFSFAGSLGVAAMHGGAKSMMHLDSQKRALKRCKQNHILNQQRVDDRDLVCDDVYRWLKRAQGKTRLFGGVIIDPPPSKERDLVADLTTIMRLGGGVLDDGGWLLLLLHGQPQFAENLPEGWTIDWRGESGRDFPEEDPTRKLEVLAIRKAKQK